MEVAGYERGEVTGGLLVGLDEGGGRSDEDGGRDPAGRSGKVVGLSSDGVQGNRRVGEKRGQGQDEGVAVGERVGGKEEVGWAHLLGSRNGEELGSNGRGEVTSCEGNHLGRDTGLVVPEEDDIRGLLLIFKRGKLMASGGGAVTDDLMPGRNIDVAAGTLGDFVPVHMPRAFFDDPNQLTERRVVLSNEVEGETARGSDDSVSTRPAQHRDNILFRLLEGKNDGREVVEGTGKEGRK